MENNELMSMPVNELMTALIHSEVDADPAEDELQHWGVQGMRWGVRRYQNKDGSLTKAGKKRYGTRTNFDRVQAAKKAAEKYNSKEAKAKRKADARAEAEIAKYRKKMGEKDKKDDDSDESKPKTTSGNETADAKPKKTVLSELSDDELRVIVNRLNMEKQYRQYMAELHPQTKSAGKKFVEKTFNDVIVPAATQSGRTILQNQFTKMGENLLKNAMNDNGSKPNTNTNNNDKDKK